MTDLEQQVENISITVETITGLSKTINDLVGSQRELFAQSATNADLGLKLTALSAAAIEAAKKANCQLDDVEKALFMKYHAKDGEK